VRREAKRHAALEFGSVTASKKAVSPLRSATEFQNLRIQGD